MAMHLGFQSNNYGEYAAVILSQIFQKIFKLPKVMVRTDSRLVCEQLNGNWKVLDTDLAKLINVSKSLGNVSIEWVKRDQNSIADYLSKLGSEGSTIKPYYYYDVESAVSAAPAFKLSR